MVPPPLVLSAEYAVSEWVEPVLDMKKTGALCASIGAAVSSSNHLISPGPSLCLTDDLSSFEAATMTSPAPTAESSLTSNPLHAQADAVEDEVDDIDL